MSASSSLNGKVALVTGAAQGIGRAICERLAESGAHVIAADIQANEVKATAKELGERVTPVALDVTSETQWAACVETVLSDHGQIDVLVNNAGILLFSTLETTTPDQFRRLLDINVTGSFLGLHAVIPGMKKRGSGVIINMSSSSAILPNNGTGAYAASKFAVRGMTRTAALELGPSGIRVNSVHPGGVNTPMTNPKGVPSEEINARYTFVPQQRGCEPEEIANVVNFLASDQASYCNGAEIVVDGGLTAGQYFYGIPGAPDSSR